MSAIKPHEVPASLGVDGGGTSTTALLADAEGRVLGRGLAGASNPKAIGFDAAFRALDGAVDSAFAAAGVAPQALRAACLGLAGFAQAEDQDRLRAWAQKRTLADRLMLVSDGDLVLAAGTPAGLGVAIIAGTGSIAVGRGPDGQTARAGGWGYLFGDEGSAYVTVLAALRRCARRADGREPRPDPTDPLTDRFLRTLGVAQPSDLISAVYARGLDRTQIAALTPVILDAIGDDPSIRPDLLLPAGTDLGITGAAVARSLDWNREIPLPVALAGGFLLRSPDVQAGLLDHLRQVGFVPEPTTVPEPVTGALILAQREAMATTEPIEAKKTPVHQSGLETGETPLA